MIELLPCPFCGSDASIRDHRLVFSVNCNNTKCEARIMGERSPELESKEQEDSTDWGALKQTAVDRWNARHA